MGIALIVLGVTAASALFDRPWLNWIGLMTHKPATEDYVPLLPWFGVLLIGMFAGRYFWRGAARSAVLDWQANGTVGRALIWAGRHSLAIYMVHQPLLIGVLYLAVGRR
jgi:uncharacterized membrane protein